MKSKVLVLAIFVSLLILALPTLQNNWHAYADSDSDCGGCPMEVQPFNGRDFGKNPIYLSYNVSTSNNHTLVKLALHENSTGQIIKSVTYFITINNTENANQEIMHDPFHTQDGMLVLDFVHSNTSATGSNNEQITIHGSQDPFLDAWIPDAYDRITITNFSMTVNKTYVMHIEVFGIDKPKNIFEPEKAPKVDFSINSENSDAEGKILIVPEFSSSFASLAIFAGLVGAIIMTARRRAGKG